MKKLELKTACAYLKNKREREKKNGLSYSLFYLNIKCAFKLLFEALELSF